jgi:hypothetical protein
MPINVTWKNAAKTILVFSYEGRWDLNDFYQSNEKANFMLDEVDHPVDLVLDVVASRTAPNGLMNAMNNTSRKLHPNTRLMIMVGLNVFARALINMYFKIYPAMYKERPIYFASNDDEIQAIIAHFAGPRDAVAPTN